MIKIKIAILILILTWLTIVNYDNTHPFAKVSLGTNHYTILSTPTAFVDGKDKEDGDEDTRPQWAQLEKAILDCPDKTIFIVDNGRGGLVSMAYEFIQVIKEAKKEGHIIIFDISKDACSMNAFIVVYGDKVILEKGAYVLFHPIYGRDRNGKKDYSFDYRFAEARKESNFMNEVYRIGLEKGLLTIEDMKEIQINHKAVVLRRTLQGVLEKAVIEDEK